MATFLSLSLPSKLHAPFASGSARWGATSATLPRGRRHSSLSLTPAAGAPKLTVRAKKGEDTHDPHEGSADGSMTSALNGTPVAARSVLLPEGSYVSESDDMKLHKINSFKLSPHGAADEGSTKAEGEEVAEAHEEKERKKEKKEKKEGKKEKEKGREKVFTLEGVMEAIKHYPDEASTFQEAAEKDASKKKKVDYDKELERLQVELVMLQEWIRTQKLRVVVIFEGRDAAGKGGIIKCISEATNPRIVSIKALGTPSDREKTQWYFQRYVAHLPAGGEMVLFDRSWYNRAGVEKVMGFCTDAEYKEFLRSCPEFERMLVRSGIILLKYWISVSPEEQYKRFKARLARPEKRWKLSDMDLQARARWSDYSEAKDIMFSYCDIKQAPWHVVPADDKKAARLNCIAHLLSQIPYEDLIVPNDVKIPPLQEDHYIRPPITDQTFVPLVY